MHPPQQDAETFDSRFLLSCLTGLLGEALEVLKARSVVLSLLDEVLIDGDSFIQVPLSGIDFSEGGGSYSHDRRPVGVPLPARRSASLVRRGHSRTE